MKKLMTVLASAATALCAVGAWADFTETSTDFEASTAGQAFDSNNGMDSHWVGASDAELFISNHTDTISVSRPDYVGRANTNANYLAIDSSVTRGLNEMSGTDFPGVAIPDNGIYLDTLVKFTAADDVFGDDALSNGVDKIAISYVAQGDDVDNPITNFVIRAGYIGAQEISAVNYMADVPENFDVSAWHRLTVRTFASIDAANHVGFVVYLDEVPLAYSTSDVCGDNFEATGLAAEFYTDELHALYPSAVDSQATGGSAIASATFSGTGCIDDVVFTTNKPGFITVDPDVTVEWDANVATLTLNGAAVKGFVAGTAGSAKVTPDEGVVTVVATFAEGYRYGACVTDGKGEWDAVNEQFTNLTPGETCSIVSMLPLFKVGGEYFDNFEDALVAAVDAGTAQNPATIQLMANCDSLLSFTEGNIVLDLAGYDVQGGLEADYSIINAGANLTIINTGTEASIKMPLSGATTAMYQDANGFTTVEAGTFEGVIQFNVDYDETFPQTYMLLKGGKFIDSDYASQSTFYLADCVQGGLSTTYDSETGYVQVGDVPPTPSSGYDSGDGTHTFTIDSTTEAALVTNLPTGKTLASAVSETSSMTYAQAYALGLWDDEADEVADLDATISVGADGKVTVSLANAPATGYLVTCKVYEKASLTDEWPGEPKTTYAYGSEQTITPASSTAGFYKVEVVISNSLQQ